MPGFRKPQPAVDTTAWFRWTLLYLLVDYVRPQDFIPGLKYVRPAMIVTMVLVFFLIRHRQLIFQNKQIKLIWYFIALLSVYVPFARNNYYAYITTQTMLLYMPFILSMLVCVNTVERLRTFTKVYIGAMVYVALYALRHGGMGSGNYFSDENDVSLYIDMVIPFCYFLFVIEKKKSTKIFYGAGLVIGLLAVIISFSRGGFVGLCVMFLIVWLVSPRKMISVVAISILGVFVYFYSGDKYHKEMATVTDTKESTAHARLMSWASAWDMFLDHPYGVGGNNFQVLFPEYQGNRFNRGMWGRVAHSLWFTLIPEVGVVGIALYFRLLWYNLKAAFAMKIRKEQLSEDERYLNAMSISFLASLAGFFTAGTFVSVLYYPHYWYVTAMIVATAEICKKVSGETLPVEDTSKSRGSRQSRWLRHASTNNENGRV